MTISDYTSLEVSQPDSLLSEVFGVGGRVRSWVDLDTGELGGVEAEVSCEQDTAATPLPLSTAHISPRIEWNAGASLLSVKNGQISEAVGGGIRGKVTGFSRASRRRLMQTIARIRKDADLPNFVTLTYPASFPTPKESKKHLDTFQKRLRRKYPDIGIIWKLEPQERGAPHYHMLTWGPDTEELLRFVASSWFEIAGNGDMKHLFFHLGAFQDSKPCVSKVRSFRGVWSYASKYLGKTFEVAGWNEQETGRYWGVAGRDNIPFGESMVMFITSKDAHEWMRYQRRFARLKSRDYKSITIFCTADQWVHRVLQAHGTEVILDQDKSKAKPAQ